MNIATLIGLIITVFFVILGFMIPKSKKVFIFQIIWTWILIALNNGGVDYQVNNNIYISSSLVDLSINNSWLYIFLCYIFKGFDINFFMLNCVFSTIGIFLLMRVVGKCTEKKAYVGSFLLIYPLIDNIIQKRFFISSCFAVYAFYLMFKKDKRYKIKSFILFFIAGSLHQASFVYYIFWILMQFDIKKIKTYISILVLFVYCSIPIIPKIAALIFPGGKVNLYFYELKLSLVDGICWMILHFLFVLLIMLFVKKIDNSSVDEDKKNLEIEIYKMNLISLILLPLYYYEPTFIRIYRTLLIFNYILIANKSNILTKNKFYLSIMWTIYIITVYFMVYVITGSGFENIVVPEYTNNYFINFLLGG